MKLLTSMCSQLTHMPCSQSHLTQISRALQTVTMDEEARQHAALTEMRYRSIAITNYKRCLQVCVCVSAVQADINHIHFISISLSSCGTSDAALGFYIQGSK